MNPTYSTYEAKARFSEVLRLVREGTPVTVTYRGDPVAEIRPIATSGPRTSRSTSGNLRSAGS